MSITSSIVSSITSPIVSSLSGFDSDAAAYIAAVETAGASVSAAQSTAINDFISTGKTEGWYSSLGRLYFPIWAAAGPNAIDMIELGSGTFNGMTHSAGFIKGNGTSEFFDTATRITDVGATTENAMIGALIKTADAGSNACNIGTGTPGGDSIRCWHSNASTTLSLWLGAQHTGGVPSGLLISSREGGTTYLSRHIAAGYSEAGTIAALTGTFSDYHIKVAATSTTSDASIASWSDAEIGAAFIGTGMDATKREDFSNALKTLWETCTELTLP